MKLYKRGFTLIEMIIVISIIGILSAALFPSVSGYLRRADNVKTQKIVNGFITKINNYVIDYGEITSNPNQTGNTYEYYCIDSDPDCLPGSPYNHVSISEYFKSTSDGQNLLREREKYCNKFPLWECSQVLLFFFRNSLSSISSYYTFPGIDMTDTRKRWIISWALDDNASYYADMEPNTQVFVNGNNMPEGAVKRCLPGFPQLVSNWEPDDVYTQCFYILNQ